MSRDVLTPDIIPNGLKIAFTRSESSELLKKAGKLEEEKPQISSHF